MASRSRVAALTCLVLVPAMSAPAAGRSQQIGFHGALARVVDLPTDPFAFRCEPMSPEHTRDNSQGVRNCAGRTRLDNGVMVNVMADSTGRVVALILGWPRATDPDSTVSRLNAALEIIERRLGRASICGRADFPWEQAYHWDTPEWSASLSATRNTTTNGPAAVQFNSWIKNPDEVVTCMTGPGMRPRDDRPRPPIGPG